MKSKEVHYFSKILGSVSFGCNTMLTLAQGDPIISAHENREKVNLQALMVIERSSKMKTEKTPDLAFMWSLMLFK